MTGPGNLAPTRADNVAPIVATAIAAVPQNYL
jgi:hypothetical protein